MKKYQANLVMLLVTVIWGFSFVLIDILFKQGVTPGAMIAVRGLLFSITAFLLFRKKIMKMTKIDFKVATIAGLINALAFLLQNYAQQFTLPSHCALLTTMYVLFIPFVMWVMYRIPPKLKTIISVVLCFGGATVLVGDQLMNFSFSEGTLYGDALTVVSALIFAISIAYIGKAAKETPTEIMSFMVAVTLFVVGAVYCLLFEIPLLVVPKNIWLSIGILLYLGLLASGFCQVMQIICQKHTSPVSISIICTMEGVFGGLFSILFGEQASLNLLIGGLMIVFSILLQEVFFPLLEKKRSLPENADQKEK